MEERLRETRRRRVDPSTTLDVAVSCVCVCVCFAKEKIPKLLPEPLRAFGSELARAAALVRKSSFSPAPEPREGRCGKLEGNLFAPLEMHSLVRTSELQ